MRASKQPQRGSETPQRGYPAGWIWLVFLALAWSASAAHLTLQGTARGILFNLVGLTCAAAIVWGVRRNRAVPRAAWVSLALGILSSTAGDLVWVVHEVALGSEPPFPGPQDAMYLLGYVFQFFGLLLLTRAAGGRDRESLVDAITVSISVAVVAWVFYLDNITRDGFVSDLVSAAYPLLDLALLALLLRLMLSAATFTPSLLLLGAAVLTNLFGDGAYLVVRLTSGFEAGGTLDVVWLLAYALLGAAALHPSARIVPNVARADVTLPRIRLALLIASAFTAPALIVYQYTHGHVDVILMVGATVILFGLVVLRLVQITSALGRAVDHEATRFEALVSNATDAITILELDGAIRYSSPAVLKVWGREPAELEGRFLRDLIAPGDAALFDRAFEEMMDTLRPVTFEVRVGDGDVVRWLEITAQDLSGDAVIEGVVLNQRDITARKEAAEKTRHREEIFRTVVEKVPAIVYMAEAGPENGWIYLSPQIEPLLGYKPQEWIADPSLWYDRLHPEDRGRAIEEEQKSWQHPSVDGRHQSEYRFITRDDRVVWLSDEWSVIRHDNGEPAYFSGVLLDITESKRLEDQMRQTQKMEAVGRLAGGVAHDFNNLLSVIQNCTRFASEEIEKNHPAQEDLREVLGAGDRAARLTKQLLAFSRQEIVRPEVLDLNASVAAVEGLLRRTVRENIDLQVRAGSDPSYTSCDPGQIEQIVMNLVVNAQDAMPRGGSLVIETSSSVVDEELARRHPGMKPGGYVRLRVSDTGTGMSKETKDRIFEPFFTTKERGSGTGLGLATVYGIVKRLEGYIVVHTEIGRGTTFDIYLPPSENAPGEDAAGPQAPAQAGGDETILVVEDNDSVRSTVSRLLTRRGFNVLEASFGGEALELYRRSKQDVDLVLTDVIMPKMSGRELADLLRAEQPDVKVVFMSGYTDDAIADQGLLTDPSLTLIQKPFGANDLIDVLRAELDTV